MARLLPPRVRFLTAGLLVALTAACGSGAPDTEVLGARVAANEGAAAPPEQAPTEAPEPTTTTTEAPAPTTTTTAVEPAPEPGPTTTTTVATTPAGAAVLELSLGLEATEVPAGSDVRGVLTAVNPTDQDVDITHPSLCETEQGLYRDGQPATSSMVCAGAMKADRVGPHETRTWSIRIVTDGVSAGTYEARAGINLRSEADRFAPGVPVTLLP